MIGQASWFQRRKYGGWGLSPRTWQGWAYIVAVGGLIFGFRSIVPEPMKIPVMYALSGIFALDLIHIMITLPKDEMENKIEAVAERNAVWGMIVVLGIGLAYQSAQSMIHKSYVVDPFIIVSLVVGVILKAISNFWLERKGI